MQSSTGILMPTQESICVAGAGLVPWPGAGCRVCRTNDKTTVQHPVAPSQTIRGWAYICSLCIASVATLYTTNNIPSLFVKPLSYGAKLVMSASGGLGHVDA